MNGTIDDVVVVGGSDVGLLTALAVQRLNPAVDVAVIDDFQEEIPQVGKSTYVKICQILHGSLGIDEQRFVSAVKPVWKASVYFRDWCGYPRFHYPFDEDERFPAEDTPDTVEHFYYYYDELADSPDHRTTCEEMVERRKSPWHFSEDRGQYRKHQYVAYHLDTERFNTFLRELCRERGVSLVDDEVVSVTAAGNRIAHVRSQSQRYEADLYVDATGFNRVLKGELDGEFVDFGLPLDSAFNARVERSLEEAVPATVVETGEYGWFWQIDTYDNRDLGYVFASEYVDDEAALAEFQAYVERVAPDGATLPGDDDVANYEFTSGYFDPPWEGNCVAIGNAEGFVEPLRSTGLTVNAHAAVKLANLLSSHGRVDGEGIRDTYNAWVRRSWESIYDFISVHYRYGRGDTEFWEDVTSLDVSPRVEELVRAFDRSGFDGRLDVATSDDDRDVDPLAVFRPINFYTIMRHMGATSEFYETNDFDVSDAVKREDDEYYENVRDRVADFFTTEQFYERVLGAQRGPRR